MTPRKKAAVPPESPAPEPKQSGTEDEALPEPRAAFPIVGIGASAGGLAAFEAFFSGMPADIDPGMAFVLVQHLAPDHKSILTELIRRYTRMQVSEATDGVEVQPNCAYIIPPNRDMAFLNGTLQLLEPASPRHRHRHRPGGLCPAGGRDGAPPDRLRSPCLRSGWPGVPSAAPQD